MCDSCNIAISVRVGSPGNTGDLVQSIAAETAAAASDIAGTIQTALQAAPRRRGAGDTGTCARRFARSAGGDGHRLQLRRFATAAVATLHASRRRREDDPSRPVSPRLSRGRAPARRASTACRDARRGELRQVAGGRSPATGRAAAIVRRRR